ncbi:MAG: hypothetical protein ACOX6J_04780 [Oscillospiraceae bacterium]|jgi:hypothetical protein
MEPRGEIVIMPLNWYEFGNIYTGSCRGFRYRLAPDTKAKTVKVSAYSGKAYELADDITEESVELSEEGLQKAREWLTLRLEEYRNDKEKK